MELLQVEEEDDEEEIAARLGLLIGGDTDARFVPPTWPTTATGGGVGTDGAAAAATVVAAFLLIRQAAKGLGALIFFALLPEEDVMLWNFSTGFPAEACFAEEDDELLQSSSFCDLFFLVAAGEDPFGASFCAANSSLPLDDVGFRPLDRRTLLVASAVLLLLVCDGEDDTAACVCGCGCATTSCTFERFRSQAQGSW